MNFCSITVLSIYQNFCSVKIFFLLYFFTVSGSEADCYSSPLLFLAAQLCAVLENPYAKQYHPADLAGCADDRADFRIYNTGKQADDAKQAAMI